MTVCNMSIEGGARAGMIAPDEKTFAYLKGRPKCAEGRGSGTRRCAIGRRCVRDEGAHFDKEVRLDAARPAADRLLGHEPAGRRRRSAARCRASRTAADEQQARLDQALARLHGPAGRREDHRHRDRPRLHRLLHQRPHRGSARRRRRSPRAARSPSASTRWSCRARAWSRRRPRRKGSTRSSSTAGFEWREPGCSMCLAMNPDKLEPGERCASTSNRNFEGRQGSAGRTHLVSPAMAAAAAIAGRFVDVRDWR